MINTAYSLFLPLQLEHQLEAHESKHATSLRSVRNVDRTVRDLQAQISRRDKQAQQLLDDIAKGREKIERLLQTVDELQAEEARSQLAAKRAERDLREEREKALRLERELEGWKGLRMERGSKLGGSSGWGSSGSEFGGNVRPGINGNEWNGSFRGAPNGSRHRSDSGSGGGGEAGNRRLSDSKGFL